jgi:hypothetical protein
MDAEGIARRGWKKVDDQDVNAPAEEVDGLLDEIAQVGATVFCSPARGSRSPR